MDGLGVYNTLSLTRIAASLAAIMGIEAPRQADRPTELLTDLPKSLGKGKTDRILMYNPDAIGLEVFQKYTELFAPALRHTQAILPMITVMPSVTPVCFGTMYTGALPEVHGIRAYTKPVIHIDTIFDTVIRSGRKAAIIADGECSMGRIFLERPMDYFIFENVKKINEKALELIECDEHDFIAVYNGNYDSTMHKHGPDAPESIAELKANIAAFDMLAGAVSAMWKDRHTALLGFAPDHGCHKIDGDSGGHGLDMPSDLNIIHFYGMV